MRCSRSAGSIHPRSRRWPLPPTATSFRRGPRSCSPAVPSKPRKSIVTRAGDRGQTGLLYGGRVSKTDLRTEAYGAVDETISALGLARALTRVKARRVSIMRVQRELFTVGAELATHASEYDTLPKHLLGGTEAARTPPLAAEPRPPPPPQAPPRPGRPPGPGAPPGPPPPAGGGPPPRRSGPAPRRHGRGSRALDRRGPDPGRGWRRGRRY